MKQNGEKDQMNGLNGLDNVQVIERRHFIRHPLPLPLTYRVIRPRLSKGMGDTEDARSETINVSTGGLLFPATHPVKTNSLIAIRMPFEDKVFNLKARVIRCVNNPKTNLYDIAVSFFRVREAFRAKMIEQIFFIKEYRDLLTLQSGREISLEEASRDWVKRYSEQFKTLYW